MRFRHAFIVVIVTLAVPSQGLGAEPVFSGPQAGEKLPPLSVEVVLGKTAGRKIDLIRQAEGKPVLLAFFHARTRPAFGLTNLLMKYGAMRAKDGLRSSVIMLTDDATGTAQWMKQVEKHFTPEAITYAISPDGKEGPGSYGLNRNVQLTILVGKEGKVTGNFALVQPSVQADGPKILKSIVDTLGSGKVPTLAELGGVQYRNTPRNKKMNSQRPSQPQPDQKLVGLLRSVIQKDATADDVKKAAAAVDAYVKENEKARKQLGEIAARVANSGKLSNYGTKQAQEAIRKWATRFGPRPSAKNEDRTRSQDSSEPAPDETQSED